MLNHKKNDMKKGKLLLLAFIFCMGTVNATIKNVYVARGAQSLVFSSVNGKVSWPTFIGSSKLAFVKGESYRLKMEYSTSVLGLLTSSSTQAVLTNKTRNGNILECTMTISATANRLGTFNIGPAGIQGQVTDPIACEIVEVGSLYSMTLTDPSSTTMSSMVPKSNELNLLSFIKGTQNLVMTFKGQNLGNVKLNTSGLNIEGIVISSSTLTSVSSNSFSVLFSATALTSSPRSIKDNILSRIYDSAADKPYSWLFYNHVKMIPPSGIADPGVPSPPAGGGLNSSGARFEELPGVWVTLSSSTGGFRGFLNAKYEVK